MSRIQLILFLITAIGFLIENGLIAQTAPGKYLVEFTDKLNSPFSVGNPAQYLSSRAIQRRTNQGISIIENDLPVNTTYINAVLAAGNITLLHRSKWFNAITIATTDTAALDSIKTMGFVKQVKSPKRVSNSQIMDDKFKLEDESEKAYELMGESPWSGIDYGNGLNQSAMLNADFLHYKGFKGQGMLIAVIDAGFTGVDTLLPFNHLFSNNQVVGTWDFVDADQTVYHGSTHGRAVLSTIAANTEAEFIGTAPEADFILLRTEDTSSEYIIEEDNWVAAAEFADSAGADVLTTSLGYTTFDDTVQNHTYLDLDGNTARISVGADIAASKGMLVLNSAGNSGSSSWYYIGAAADGDSVLAIGAVTADSLRADFSSFGPSADGRVKPDIMAQGRFAVVYDGLGKVSLSNGTSFSCPIMAGAAACLWQAAQQKTNMEIYKAIQQSAHLYETPNNSMGYGIPNLKFAYEFLTGDSAKPIDVLKDSVAITPNPFIDFLNLAYFADEEKMITIKLYDGNGKLVTAKMQKVVYGKNEISVNYLHLKLAKGNYTLVTQTGNQIVSSRAVKL